MRRGDIFSGSTNIRVIGVGGGGGNAVNRMIQSGIQGVEFIVANTDTAALAQSQAPTRIPMGVHLTHGRSTGGNQSLGEKAALESLDELRDVIDGADMLFLAAGLGGGTGTGATPVIAELAQELGVLTISIVTRPFSFEGRKRANTAV
ncbi:MAG: cell division protein FtsZ, partial [Anaerolineae bacterium]